MSCKCVDAERRDAEVEPDGARKDAAVIDLVDLVDLRHRVTAHSAVLLQVVWGHLAAQSNERPGTDRPPRRGDTVDARLGQCPGMSHERYVPGQPTSHVRLEPRRARATMTGRGRHRPARAA